MADDWKDLPPDKKLGDAPIQQEFIEQMQAVARTLDEFFNGEAHGQDRKTGFVLMVFPFNEIEPGGQGRCNYISNGADRKDIVKLMTEMIASFTEKQ